MDQTRLLEMCVSMRCDIIKMTHIAGANGAHIGGSLSLVEIMAALYGVVMHLAPLQTEARDRLILSKGHGAMALYAALNQTGFIPKEDLWTYKANNSYITGHPTVSLQHGVEFPSGSLGQGLSLGVGIALAMRHKGGLKQERVFVIHGDGECDEGSVWEAAASASHFHLNNLVAIVDRNRMQYDGPTEDILNMENLAEKWNSFGFETEVVDGHDLTALCEAFSRRSDSPRAVICNTVKGKGVSFIENDHKWHNGVLNQQQYAQAMQEQGVEV